MEISKLQVTNLLPVFSIMFCPIFLVFNMLLFQQSIAKAIEEKISGDQRRYLLNEQLKAIKKVLSLLCLYWSYQATCVLTVAENSDANNT